MNRLLFWDVDTQADFMLPEGKLYVPGAEKLIPNLRGLTAFGAEHGIPVVSSVDAHLESDSEFKQYPPHCLAGTPGQEKVAGTVLSGHFTVPNREINLPEDMSRFRQVIVEKQDVDVFTNPNIELLLARFAGDREIILYGVVTEICVDRAARGLIQRGRHVHLVTDAVMPMDAAKAEATIHQIRCHGGMLLSTDEILAGVLQPTS
jgi:nicotinamidase/pyrazinamidase